MPSAQRLSDVVATQLENRILEGSLKPGDRLPSERELAVDLGVSRPSLRGALQSLVAKGLLITRHGGGTFVTDSMQAAFTDPWQQMLKDHPDIHGDMLEFRHMLEGQAAQLAAERGTEEDFERIRACHEALEIAFAAQDLEQCIKTDVEFHQAIAEASHNALIGHLSSSLHKVMEGHVQSNLEYLTARPELWAQLRAQHHAIWDAVRERRMDVAQRAAHHHLEFVRQTMRETMKNEERRSAATRRLSATA
ncbi:transcriptional regulator, GntR family [Duganella sp. CF458]|uniref:FCD domain-containing protein n=1 Tax=Duganella sp. CF458 TaxID=1884368 RepID=UPI0008E34C4D|nr:FCD domain-containing protein [Duganella sp. CF458]SFG75196.1 transcriptional regulator, GntR family [Duganella sp. CF458]